MTMDPNDIKKYSDKLFFALLSGKELDADELSEITELYTEEALQAAKPKETWEIAYEHKDKLKLQTGEYPRLFDTKVKEEKSDKFSENAFFVNGKGLNALFVPVPSSLLLGDLIRATPKPEASGIDLLLPIVNEAEQHQHEEERAFADEQTKPAEAPLEASTKNTTTSSPQTFESLREDLVAAKILLVEVLKETKTLAKDKLNSWLEKKLRKGNGK